MFSVDRAPDEGRQRRIIGLLSWDEQALVGQVADTRREPESQQVHQSEHVIRKTRRIGIVFLDAKIGFMVQEAIKHIGRIPDADIDDLRMKRRVLIGHVRVEENAGVAAIFRIDVAAAFGMSAGLEPLPV